MCKNIDDFLYDISNLNHSILTFSETWLSNSSQHYIYDIPKFNAFHQNRENKQEDVAIFVSEKYSHTPG